LRAGSLDGVGSSLQRTPFLGRAAGYRSWRRLAHALQQRSLLGLSVWAAARTRTPLAQVVAIPTNRPPRRVDLPLRVYFDPQVHTCGGGALGAGHKRPLQQSQGSALPRFRYHLAWRLEAGLRPHWARKIPSNSGKQLVLRSTRCFAHTRLKFSQTSVKPPGQPPSPQVKYLEVVNIVKRCWRAQRPLLIGTTSVNESETVLQV
jgi:hypothetical protein